MTLIGEHDLAYLRSKYHDPGTYNPEDRNRWILQDEHFDPATGRSGEALCALVREEDEKIVSLPHSLRKANAFRLVMENTRIACDPRDYFPAVHSTDRRPIGQLIARWKKEVFSDLLPEIGAEMRLLEESGAVTIWPDYDHNIPVWERVFALGFPGLLEDVKRARKEKARRSPLTEKEAAFYDSILVTYSAILHLLRRMRGLAASLPEPSGKTPELIAALDTLLTGAPRTLYEALLLIYLYFMCSEHVECLQVRSLCNMDRLLTPFYRADRAAGISEEKERTVLAYFLMQFAAIDNYWGQPLYLGGTNPDGTTVVSEFSHMLLEVYDQLGILTPKIQIKYSDTTPVDFVRRALDMIRRGHSSIVFVCEDTIVRSLRRRGIPEAEARRCEISGCYETKMPGAMGTGMNYLNLVKPLEYVLHRGRDGVTGAVMGPDLGLDFPTFDDFFAAYRTQLASLIDRTVRIVNTFEPYLGEMNPQPMLAATFSTCLEAGRDPFEGSCTLNDSGIAVGFLANAADSLSVIKKYVYDEHRLTLSELTAILDRNWEGAELLRRQILADPDHYGNNRELPDSLAAQITRFLTDRVNGLPNAAVRGGQWGVGLHVARQSYDQGKKTLASPDGRRFGEELSKNASPSMGMCRRGATAAVLSIAKLDAVELAGDCPLDMGLLPSAVQGEDGLDAMLGVLSAFNRMGGHAIHFNVFNGEILRDAQAHPEKYADLQIRVCGWNVLFNQMKKEEQDGFIRQAEALA